MTTTAILLLVGLVVLFIIFTPDTDAEPPLKFPEIDPNLLPTKETT